MTNKSAKRVAAGKRAWARSRGQNMRKKNRNNKQGIASWLTSVIALGMGLANPVIRIIDASKGPPGKKLAYWFNLMMNDYTGYNIAIAGLGGDNTVDVKRMIRGYAGIGGGIVFKKSTTYLVKVAKVKSLIPRLGL
jgi:hypothetical protein